MKNNNNIIHYIFGVRIFYYDALFLSLTLKTLCAFACIYLNALRWWQKLHKKLFPYLLPVQQKTTLGISFSVRAMNMYKNICECVCVGIYINIFATLRYSCYNFSMLLFCHILTTLLHPT